MAGDSLAITQTGLQGVDTAMQAVSDNLANAQTVGYQSEAVDFETLLGQFIAGSPLGGGVTSNGITRDFSEGPITQESSPTDLAIQGNGFFVLQDASGNTSYTRNGQLTIGSNGDLQGFNGDQVMGYGVDSAGNPSGVLGAIVIPQGVSAPTASTTTTLNGNLDAASPVIAGAINPADPTTYNSSVSVQVFDSLGNGHVLTFYFQNAGAGVAPAAEDWNWSATLDGSSAGLTGNSGTIGFDANGNLVTGGTPAAPLTATPTGAAPLSLSLNLAGLTQYAGTTAATGVANGGAVGQPTGIQVSTSGVISVSYSNGNILNVADVALATFPSQQGLQLTSGGTYQQTLTSGTPTVATSGAGGAGTIQASSLEQSNVDTTGQIIDLVALQNSFAANAKALQTEATILNNIVSIQTP